MIISRANGRTIGNRNCRLTEPWSRISAALATGAIGSERSSLSASHGSGSRGS